MKVILVAILFFCNSIQSQDYVANWAAVPKEPNVINYQVQKSSNNITWITIATIQPKKSKDTNKYSYTLPAANNYIRIKSLLTTTTLYSASIRVINTNVTISNAILKINPSSDNLSFVASNEGEASYYSIQRKNSSSSTWVVVGKLWQTNKRNYMVNISKIGSSRVYRLQVVYKNEIVSPYINFQ